MKCEKCGEEWNETICPQCGELNGKTENTVIMISSDIDCLTFGFFQTMVHLLTSAGYSITTDGFKIHAEKYVLPGDDY